MVLTKTDFLNKLSAPKLLFQNLTNESSTIDLTQVESKNFSLSYNFSIGILSDKTALNYLNKTIEIFIKLAILKYYDERYDNLDVAR